LEINSAAVTEARKAGLDVEKRSISQEASQRPHFYDVVCHFQVLEHVEDPFGLMRDAASVIKPGGLMVFAVPSEDSFLGIAESSLLNMPPHHLTRWTDQALFNLLDRVGLEPMEAWHETVADYHSDWHRQVLVGAGLRSLVHAKPELLGSGWSNRLNRILSRLPNVGQYLAKRGLSRYPLAARGHSVCVVAASHGRARA
jgi:SAM-dependent methyltransferase